MKYAAKGIGKDDGCEKEIVVDAESESEAAQMVRDRGFLPTHVRLIRSEHPRATHKFDSWGIRIFLLLVALLGGGYLGIRLLAVLNPFKRDPDYRPIPINDYRSNRDRLWDFHAQGRFLGYSLDEADQWAEDYDKLLGVP